MQASSEQTKSLVNLSLVTTVLVAPSELNALAEKVADVLGRSHDASILIGDVVLHARLLVNAELYALINRAAESAVVLGGILVLGVVLGVVDVVLGTVAAKTISCDLELAGAIAKSHKTQDTEQQPDSLGGNGLDSADIDGLGIITNSQVSNNVLSEAS